MINEILTAVQNVGVTVVSLGACMWYIKYRDDKNDNRLSELEDKHLKEVDTLRKSIDNNTAVMHSILGYLQGKEEIEEL